MDCLIIVKKPNGFSESKRYPFCDNFRDAMELVILNQFGAEYFDAACALGYFPQAQMPQETFVGWLEETTGTLSERIDQFKKEYNDWVDSEEH